MFQLTKKKKFYFYYFYYYYYYYYIYDDDYLTSPMPTFQQMYDKGKVLSQNKISRKDGRFISIDFLMKDTNTLRILIDLILHIGPNILRIISTYATSLIYVKQIFTMNLHGSGYYLTYITGVSNKTI